MRARTGKIARLPGVVREELNRRLHNGALGKDLVPWLNELPEVKRVLAERFEGRPISEHNVSEWRQGGFQDWLREEQSRARVREITEEYKGLGPNGARLLDRRVQELTMAELGQELEQLSAIADGNERFRRLQGITQELCRLQHAHLRVRNAQLREEKSGSGGSRSGVVAQSWQSRAG